MRDELFSLLLEYKHKEVYAECYQARAQLISNVLTGINLFVSASSIASWGIWATVPALWIVILCFAQVVQLLRPLFPFEKRVAGLKYFVPEVKRLVVDLENEWRVWRDCGDPDKYNSLVYQYQQRYTTIDARYLGGELIPRIESLDTSTENECKRYFALHYDTIGGNETNVREENSIPSAEAHA